MIRAASVSIDLTNIPAKGLAAAPVTVVEYSDFLCSYCRDLAFAFSKFVPQSNGRVIVHFKNFPLDKTCNDRLMGSTHPGACNLALGGICAHNQGKFEAYHDKVFSSDLRNPQPADVVRIGGDAGLDAAALQSCLDDPKANAELAAQIAEGNRLGVSSTPTVYVNGKKLPRISDFLSIVDKEARKKGFKPMTQ
jgi:protein-disulfide isomerase